MEESDLYLQGQANQIFVEYKEAINSNDLTLSRRYELLIEECAQRELLGDKLQKEFKKLKALTAGRLHQFLMSLRLGDKIEILIEKEKSWYLGQVISEGVDEKGYLDVHYIGWSKKYDETVSISTRKINPPECFIVIKRAKRTSRKLSVAETPQLDIVTTSASSEVPAEEVVESEGSGRPRRKSAISSYTPEQSAVEQADKKKSTSKSRQDKKIMFSEWNCGVCGMLEAPSGGDLIVCDGTCMKAFHYECLGMEEEAADDWQCKECSTGEHSCFLCNEAGVDHKDVFKCLIPHCGKYYHEKCLGHPEAPFLRPEMSSKMREISDQEKLLAEQHKLPTTILKKLPHIQSLKFKCPRHVCDTCFAHYGSVDTYDLSGCMYCPRAFHPNCIPPGSRFNSVLLVCPLHPDKPLPPLSSTTINNDEKSTFAVFWEQLGIPDYFSLKLLKYQPNFYLPYSVKLDIANQPPSFTHIASNNYTIFPMDKLPPVVYNEEGCECTVACDERCFNYVMRVECTPKLCALKCNDKACFNRKMQKCKYAEAEVFREGAMGWGLRAKAEIRKGDLVIEYMGEIIDEVEMHRRLISQATETPHDKDYYVMELDLGVYVDGKKKGNDSRFINHSCDPNCELQRWNVKGAMHIAIVAIKDIALNEPLSYDYQFDTQEENVFKCYCNTSRCRGTMAPRKRDRMAAQAIQSNDRELRMKLIQQGKQKVECKIGFAREEEAGRSYTSKYLPGGDPVYEVKGGPAKSTLAFARDSGCFLLRNATQGNNFMLRKKLTERHMEEREKEEEELKRQKRRKGKK